MSKRRGGIRELAYLLRLSGDDIRAHVEQFTDAAEKYEGVAADMRELQETSDPEILQEVADEQGIDDIPQLIRRYTADAHRARTVADLLRELARAHDTMQASGGVTNRDARAEYRQVVERTQQLMPRDFASPDLDR